MTLGDASILFMRKRETGLAPHTSEKSQGIKFPSERKKMTLAFFHEVDRRGGNLTEILLQG